VVVVARPLPCPGMITLLEHSGIARRASSARMAGAYGRSRRSRATGHAGVLQQL